MKFEKSYTEYWESATNKSVDGLKIPGPEEVKVLIQYLGIKPEEKVLDLGCSFGRMYNELAYFSNNVFGVDPDPYAVEKAAKFPYEEVKTGTAEDTGFVDAKFDIVFSWQVFDVVDQLKGLKEVNRILVDGGRFLITGKNNNYFSDDIPAFKAEKNAFIKKFPNHFTKLDVLVKHISEIGFKIEKLFLFRRRGDFGNLDYLEVDINQILPKSYEFLMVAKKTESVNSITPDFPEIDGRFSITAEEIAKEKSFSNAEELFYSIGID